MVPHPVGWLNPAAELAVTSGDPWPEASPVRHKLNSISVNAKPANLRNTVNDVVAIAFLPKNDLISNSRERLLPTPGSRLLALVPGSPEAASNSRRTLPISSSFRSPYWTLTGKVNIGVVKEF